MGTTLTGTTPASTYDSLIKVTDNDSLDATLKTLSDGLGNDSALALSTLGMKLNVSATLVTDPASISHYGINNYLYVRGGTAGLVMGDDALSNRIEFIDGGDIKFETNEIERVRITSAGYVGIGTNSPAYKLDVTGDIRTSVASGNGSLYINNSSLSSKFWTFIPETAAGETNLLFFYGGTGAGTKMTITNAGNVGIGNPSPLNQLDLNNTGAPTLFDAGLDVVQNGGTIELNYIAAGQSGGRDGAHIFKTGLTTGGTEVVRFTSAGYVGIGTSSPNTNLQINQSNATATLRIKGGLNEITSIGQINSQLDFASNDSSVFETDGVAGRIALVNEAPNGANVGLGFYTYAQPTFSEKVRISCTGNVGIGTSEPDTKLQVAATGAAGLSVRSNTSGDAFMRYYLDGTIASDAYVDRATGVLNIRSNQDGSAIAFSTSSALIERVRVTDNGLTFNGDTAAANALDDYEEGTWTPQVYYQNGTDQSNSTNVTQVGTYTKIGRQVTLCGVLEWTITGSPAVDNIGVKNLPFTSLNAANYFAYGVLQLHNADSYPSEPLVLDLGFNSTIAAFITVTGGSNQGANIGTTGTKLARFEISYFV